MHIMLICALFLKLGTTGTFLTILLVFLVTHCIGATDCAVEAAGFVFMCARIFIVIYTELIQCMSTSG